MNFEVNSLSALHTAAKSLLEFAADEKIFVFEGEMGAGKTTFIKSICEVLGVTDNVSSPTFSIVNEYAASAGNLYHFDFYRIKNIAEAYDIGYEDYFYSGQICLIEWPQLIEELLPESYIKVTITISAPEIREFNFSKINFS